MTRHRGDEISWPCHGEALYIPLLSLSLSFSLIAPNHSISSPFFFLSLSSLPPSLLLSVSFFTTRMNIFPSSAASSSDRMEESSETGAISAEIESQNGENDCECFLPSPPLPSYPRGRTRRRENRRRKVNECEREGEDGGGEGGGRGRRMTEEEGRRRIIEGGGGGTEKGGMHSWAS